MKHKKKIVFVFKVRSGNKWKHHQPSLECIYWYNIYL